MRTATVEMAGIDLGEGLKVGDEFDFTAKARIVGIREDLVDVTPIGGPETFVPGESAVSLYITEVKVSEARTNAKIERQKRIDRGESRTCWGETGACAS